MVHNDQDSSSFLGEALIVGGSRSTNQTCEEGAPQTFELPLQGKFGMAKTVRGKIEKTLEGTRT